MKILHKTLLTLFLLIISVACGSNSQSTDQTGSKTINAEELKVLLSDGVRLIDVRTPGEFAGGRIQGASLINFQDENFQNQISKLDKDQPVAVYCAAGGRSSAAAQTMEELGFSNIYNYKGGFSDWKERGERIESD